MKCKLISILLVSALAPMVSLNAQSLQNLSEVEQIEAFDNIYVKQLDDDSLSSTYLIWVKSGVKRHYHEHHTEVVYVLEGKGIMQLNEDEKTIAQGDYVFIPKGTRHSVKVEGEIPMKVISIQSPRFDGKDRIFEP
ncbi:MAG: cupin domain-containing protein [Salibacteraceae bacterium]